MEDINPKNDLYTLIPIEDFKDLMGVDDRDDKTARFCLVTSTLTIEEYCKRKFLRKQYFEVFKWSGHLVLILKEYPVSEMLAVYTYNDLQVSENCGMILEPEFYRPMIGNDYNEEMPFELLLSSSLKPHRISAIKVNYLGGYVVGSIPENLSAACLELASWNFNRYKGTRIGMSGNIRGAGVQGEHFEMSIPENVKSLIEPFKRKLL
jgi:hypothetical protein